MVIHEIPPLTRSMVARIESLCCKLPIKQLPMEHEVTTEPGQGTCDGTPPRVRTAFGDSTGADNPESGSDIEFTDRYGKRLLAENSLTEDDGLLVLTSGDGVHLSKDQVVDLAHTLIKRR